MTLSAEENQGRRLPSSTELICSTPRAGRASTDARGSTAPVGQKKAGRGFPPPGFTVTLGQSVHSLVPLQYCRWPSIELTRPRARREPADKRLVCFVAHRSATFDRPRDRPQIRNTASTATAGTCYPVTGTLSQVTLSR